MKARGEQMERLIGAMGGETPSQHPVPSKYVTAEQMERLIEAAGSGGGGGSDEPLIVTLTPTNPLNPLGGGTHNASEADLSAAWASGRKIRAVISGVAEFDLSSFVASPTVYCCDFVYEASENAYVLVHAFIRAATGTYGCNIFPFD